MEFCGHKALNSLPKGLPFANGVFDEFRDKDFLSAYLVDPNRDFLDRRVNCDLLGFDEDIFQADPAFPLVVRRAFSAWRNEAPRRCQARSEREFPSFFVLGPVLSHVQSTARMYNSKSGRV